MTNENTTFRPLDSLQLGHALLIAVLSTRMYISVSRGTK